MRFLLISKVVTRSVGLRAANKILLVLLHGLAVRLVQFAVACLARSAVLGFVSNFKSRMLKQPTVYILGKII